MSSFAKISIRFAADLREFSSQMQNANRDIKSLGKNMQKVGSGLTLGVTAPLTALGFVAVENFDKQAKAIAQVEAGLKSTQNAVGYTSTELQKFASDLQNNTIFGDEEILQGATSQLLTFTNIAGEQFQRTQLAALDLATRLDGDLKSASIQLGKALNDPVANLSALSRSGIQFSKDQKETINTLVATNRLAEAQTLILNELENQYGGSAEAAAKAGKGGLTQLSNILGDLTEDFGKIILEALQPFIEQLKQLALSFQKLSPETKKVIVVIGALAAAIGPILVTIGFLATNVIPGLITTFAYLSTTVVPAVTGAFLKLNSVIIANPITAVAAAVGALVYGFTAFIQTITPAVSKLQTFYNLIKSGGQYSTFAALQMRDQAEATAEAAKAAEEASNKMEAFNKLNTVLSNNNYIAPKINLSGPSTIKAPVLSKLERLELDLSIEDAQNDLALLEKDIIRTGGIVATAIDEAQYEALQGKIESLNESFLTLPESAIVAANGLGVFMEKTVEIGSIINDAFKSAIQSTAEFFGEFVGSLATGSAGMKDIFNGLIGIVSNFLSSLGKALIAAGVAALSFETLFANPFLAIAAGAAAIAAASIVKSIISNGPGSGQKVKAFADGGLVYGPTLGLVGEYAGARSNPEVIAPLNKLKDLIKPASSGGGYEPYIADVRLSGQDLLIAIKRANEYKNRRS